MERKKRLEEGGKDVRNRRQTKRKVARMEEWEGEVEEEGRGRWEGRKKGENSGRKNRRQGRTEEGRKKAEGEGRRQSD